jgi:hypothetical protein
LGNSTPRELAELLRAQGLGSKEVQVVVDWLLRLEALRYAPAHGRIGTRRQLTTLRHELRRLRWGAYNPH